MNMSMNAGVSVRVNEPDPCVSHLTYGSRGVYLAELKQSVKHRAVLPYIEALQLTHIITHIIWVHIEITQTTVKYKKTGKKQ